jgi:hypothetical protein
MESIPEKLESSSIESVDSTVKNLTPTQLIIKSAASLDVKSRKKFKKRADKILNKKKATLIEKVTKNYNEMEHILHDIESGKKMLLHEEVKTEEVKTDLDKIKPKTEEPKTDLDKIKPKTEEPKTEPEKDPFIEEIKNITTKVDDIMDRVKNTINNIEKDEAAKQNVKEVTSTKCSNLNFKKLKKSFAAIKNLVPFIAKKA